MRAHPGDRERHGSATADQVLARRRGSYRSVRPAASSVLGWSCVTCVTVVCGVDDFALFTKPISMPMNFGRVLPQRAPMSCELVEELLVCVDVELISRQVLKLL